MENQSLTEEHQTLWVSEVCVSKKIKKKKKKRHTPSVGHLPIQCVANLTIVFYMIIKWILSTNLGKLTNHGYTRNYYDLPRQML
jgi:hypothetical protein